MSLKVEEKVGVRWVVGQPREEKGRGRKKGEKRKGKREREREV